MIQLNRGLRNLNFGRIKSEQEGSVTRFGEIEPFWQNLTKVWQLTNGSFGKNLNLFLHF